ncbi:potassium uptake protein TrkA [Desulfuromonas versatilis]|uniref:Potassium uptake protein TrkA n=1 Tax=Desulfuromonas versatilis TaxID=2802975 RepID=A0ABM8HSA8_9BACT|nr:TrkA family potassium uptake protein [Desulfuromonas versatilis]BCR03485.1 potassium uptake protein TrkA [Desulfuromonas versatilis]
MATGKVLIIGLGSIGLQLIRHLSRDFSLVCIDTSDLSLETARQLRGEGITTILGDATSRLVLEEAGAAEADTVIISTTTEKVNIEVARVLHEHFEVPRVVSIGITQKGIATLESLDVEVESIFNISATGIRNRLEAKTKTVHGIGLGKNEILEVEVHPNSRLVNKRLAALRSKSWRVGIIYREGNIIVPQGETSLRGKDKVVILGDPMVLKTVAEMLTFRFAHFPLEYGDTLVACFPNGTDESYLEEIGYLLSVYPLSRAMFVAARKTPELEEKLKQIAAAHSLKQYDILEATGRPFLAGLASLVKEQVRRPALLVLPKEAIEAHAFSALRKHRGKDHLVQLSTGLICPVMLAAGSFPYERVAVPCLSSPGLQRSLETTLEMSAAINYEIDALFVALSRYISSEEQAADREKMEKTVSDLRLIYKSKIREVDLTGNPITAVTGALSEHNLLVSEMASWRDSGWLASLLQPDVGWSIVRQAPVSTLLIPPVDVIA